MDGALNSWEGLAVRPQPGDWSLMKRHIWENLANRNPAHFRYIVQWGAWSIQNPAQQAFTALAFRGEEGIGKSTFGSAMCTLFGHHSVQVSDPAHITGKFNAHLKNSVMVFADEAFAAADRQSQATLKLIITEKKRMEEAKNIDAEQVRNRLKLIMATNSDWIAPMGVHSRRFVVFNVSDEHREDRAYFNALYRQMNDEGGLAAILYDLLAMDLGGWHPRQDIPETEGTREQRQRTLPPWHAAILRMVEEGRTVDPDGFKDAPGEVSAQGILDTLSLRKDDPRRHGWGISIARELKRLSVSEQPRRSNRRCIELEGGILRVLDEQGIDELRTAGMRWRIATQERRMWALRPLAECRELLSHIRRDWDSDARGWKWAGDREDDASPRGSGEQTEAPF